MPVQRHAALLLTLLLSTAAPAAHAQEALEQVVVRNRAHTVAGKLEVSADFGLGVFNRLTQHYDFSLSAGWNFAESFALEARAGYAVSSQTGLAQHVAQNLLSRDPNGSDGEAVVVNDLGNLWQM